MIALTPNDLPQPLQEAVLRFAKENEAYSDPSCACGGCVDATGAFLYDYQGCLGTVRLAAFDWEYFLDEDGGLVIDLNGAWDPGFLHDEGGYGGHTAIRAEFDGRLVFIDFTARQFDPELPFPHIWEIA